MVRSNGSSWIGLALGAAAATVAALGVVAEFVAPFPASARLPLLAGAGLLAAGGIGWAAAARRRQEAAVQQYLERLCHSEHEPCDAPLPALETHSPWSRTLLVVREALSERAGRLAEAEHAKASLELRARRLAAEHERLSSVIQELAEPVIAVDAFDEVWLANSSAQCLLALDSPNGEKRSLAKLAHADGLVSVLNETRRRKLRTVRRDELELAGPDGKKRWYGVTATSVPRPETNPAAEGELPSGVVAVLRDIQAQKAMQRENAQLVSAASHEMKTPLAGIKAYVELLADGDAQDEDTREEFLKVINDQADRLQRLIDNLLNLARIEAGVVQVSKQARSLNDVLAEAARVVRPAAEAKHIELVEALSPMYLGVHADRDMLLQAAINLLSNAIKYTAEGGRVTLRSRLLDGEVLFEVEDTGVGLSPEDCRRVFEKFYRVDRNKGMAPGTGLGLPLAKHIVEEVHGGRLEVTSTLGVGSTFSAAIPAAARTAAPSEART